VVHYSISSITKVNLTTSDSQIISSLDYDLSLALTYYNSVRTKIITTLAIVSIASIFGGCFVWSAIKDGYEDFTAYFNTYYNGETAFNDAMENVKASTMENRISALGGQQTPFVISGAAKRNFDIAIEKASKILQLYPTSKYVENCIFMIGISYYYEGDNIRSGKKFVEEQSAFPNSNRLAEAKMYYGAIEVRSREYDSGRRDLAVALGLAKELRDLKTAELAAYNLSDYYLGQGDTITAIAYLDSAASFAEDDDAAIYYCNAGNLLENLHHYSAASREYERASKEAKDFRLKFYSRYFLARTERKLKSYTLALEDLKSLRKDDKYFQFFPLIEYQQAEVLYDSGAVSSAVAEFSRIDTAYATNEGATRSAFKLANIYLYKVGDFQTALKYFQKCSAHPAVAPISSKAAEMAAKLQEYFVTSYKTDLADSLYDKAVSTKGKIDSTVNQNEAEVDTLYERAADAEKALAGFFMFNLQIPDSAIARYEKLIKNFPKSKAYPSALYTLGEYFYLSGDTAKGRGYLNKLLAEHPESSFAVSASSLLGIPPPNFVDSSQAEYDAAIDSVNAGNYSYAITTLTALSKKVHGSPIVPQALYAIGWIYENKLSFPDSAFVYYKRLSTEYPSNKLTASVALALKGYEQAQLDTAIARKRIADSLANALKVAGLDSSKAKTNMKRDVEDNLHKGQTSAAMSSPGKVLRDGSVGERDSAKVATPIMNLKDSLTNRHELLDSAHGDHLNGPKRLEK
jgi:TolA-binding protein